MGGKTSKLNNGKREFKARWPRKHKIIPTKECFSTNLVLQSSPADNKNPLGPAGFEKEKVQKKHSDQSEQQVKELDKPHEIVTLEHIQTKLLRVINEVNLQGITELAISFPQILESPGIYSTAFVEQSWTYWYELCKHLAYCGFDFRDEADRECFTRRKCLNALISGLKQRQVGFKRLLSTLNLHLSTPLQKIIEEYFIYVPLDLSIQDLVSYFKQSNVSSTIIQFVTEAHFDLQSFPELDLESWFVELISEDFHICEIDKARIRFCQKSLPKSKFIAPFEDLFPY